VKYIVCVPDGCADEPVRELGGRTPLEAAAMPTLARLAARGEVGRAATWGT
jgi:2,3-bisphosphoglycerate-independent phosphoglycerate mutase